MHDSGLQGLQLLPRLLREGSELGIVLAPADESESVIHPMERILQLSLALTIRSTQLNSDRQRAHACKAEVEIPRQRSLFLKHQRETGWGPKC